MDALALLRLQMEWGADEALEPAALNRLHSRPPSAPAPWPEASRPPPPAAPSTLPVPSAPSAQAGNGQAAAAATEAASAATTLEALRQAIAAFAGCSLRDTASNLVFADGNPAAGLLLIGEAPSAAEDRSGRAFDGPAGVYLERMLNSIGLDRQSALLTPLIPWRPPGGRPPTATEIAVCLPFLHHLIVLAAPRRLVLLGSLSARSLLDTMPRRRGTRVWLPATVPGLQQPVPSLPMASPALLLAKPTGRRDAWADLRLLRRTIETDLTNL